MAGNGLNIEVRSSSRSVPIRDDIAMVVSAAAHRMPAAYPISSTRNEVTALANNEPPKRPSMNASNVDENVGNSNGLLSQRAYSSQITASTTSITSFRT